LSYVKSIVDHHHGSIAVTSKLGDGSKFIITLPLNQPKE
jgi:signal transduction histidine kinase